MDDRVLQTFIQGVRPVDAVLTLVVDTRPAPVRDGAPAGVGDRTRAHHRPARARRLAGTELARRVDDDPDTVRVDAELLDRHLERDRVDTWPISVQQWRTSTPPSLEKRTTALMISKKPFPSPEFLSPKPRPTALPSATACS